MADQNTGGLLDFLATPAGQGLLSAGFSGLAFGKRNAPLNTLGRAGLGGVLGYTNAINQQREDEQFGLQKQLKDVQIADAQRKRDTFAAYANSIPEKDRALFAAAPEEYIKNNLQLLKPQLVEIADPDEPLRTKKVWMRAGETQGTVAGFGPMPEILDSRVQSAKEKIARAGAASTTVKLPALETEENKAVGKELGEQYAGIQKTGMSSSATISKLNRFRQLMDGVNTGKLSPTMTDLAGYADSFGIKLDPKLGQKQALVALSSELALRAKNQGGENLMPGAMSDADRRFLDGMSPSLSNTPEGNRLILETNLRLSKRDQDIARMARDYRKQNKTLDGFSDQLADWSAKNPLFDDLQKAAPTPAPAQSGKFRIIQVR